MAEKGQDMFRYSDMVKSPDSLSPEKICSLYCILALQLSITAVLF